MKKRVLSMLLVIVMIVSIMPVNAFAADGDVAAIGEQVYATLADAIAAVKNGETIKLLADCAETVTIKQQAGLSFTIDGDGHKYTGTIYVDGNKRSSGAETLTIEDVNFVMSGTYGIAAHTTKNTFPHNLTVQNCTFTGADAAYKACYGIYLRHAYNINIKNVEAKGVYDLVYGNTAVNGFAAENVKVTDSTNGIWLSYVNSTASFSGIEMDVDEVGLGFYNNAGGSVTIDDATINADSAVYLGQKNTTVQVEVTINELEGESNLMVEVDSADGKYTIYMNDADLMENADGDYVYKEPVYISNVEELVAFRNAVNSGNDFAGITVYLTADIDLAGYTELNVNHEGNNIEASTFRPIGEGTPFRGTFDGQGHTISNMYQSGWDIGYQWGVYGSLGLFAEINNATIKNLTIEGFEAQVEGGDVSAIAGSATGTCVFENITISNTKLGTYNNGCGSIIAWSGAGDYTFKGITIENDVVLGGLWGSFDSSIGGVVGQAEPGASYYFENVDIACRIDAYNDCTASYDYYNYRMCGMIMGRLEETQTIDGRCYPDTSKYGISFKNVNVTFGDWYDYHYCEPTPGLNGGRGMRVEPGYAYDGLPADFDHSQCTTNHYAVIPFVQLLGGRQINSKGMPYELLPADLKAGVTVNYPPAEARIGDTEYQTLQEAAAAAVEGDTIEILANPCELCKAGGIEGKNIKLTAAEGVVVNVESMEDLFDIAEGASVSVIGGVYAFDPAEYVAEGYASIDLQNGTWTVADGSFTIVFRNWLNGTNHGTINQTANYGQPLTLRANSFERYGYTFDHWNSKRDTDDGEFTFADQAELTVEQVNALYEYAMRNNGKAYLNAYWKGNTFTITFRNWYDGTNHGTYTQTVTYGEELTLAANRHQRYGYEFDHWNSKRDTDDGKFTFTDGQTLTVEEVAELYDYAKDNNGTAYLNTYWKGRTFTVTFRYWLGTTMGSYTQTATYGEELTLKPNTFKRTGYTFDHWNSKRDTDDGKFTFEDGASLTVEEVNALYEYAKKEGTAWLNAYWTANTFTVRFRNFVNGKLTGDVYEQTATYDSELVLIPNTFERTGYTFSHWNSHSNGNGKYNYDDCATVSVERVNGMYEYAQENNGVYTLNAQWTANEYTVTLNPDGGEVDPASKTVTYDAAVGELPTPTRTGYNFLGWYDAQGDEVTAETIYKVAGDSTYTAKWAPVTYSIRYDANGGEYTGSLPNHGSNWLIIKNGYTYDAPVTLYDGADFVRTGYTLVGWKINGVEYALGETVEINFTSVQSGTVQAYAIWKANEYTVTFDANGGEGSMAAQSFTYDVAQNLTANAFTKTGYTFTGWNTAADGTGTGYADCAEVINLSAEDGGVVTLYAIWQANSYKVAFNGNGGEGNVDEMNRVYGDGKALPENGFAKKGYTFTGWNTAADGSGTAYQPGDSVDLATEQGAVVVLYAQWRANTYTITFNANGGEGKMADVGRTYGDKQPLPECGFTKTGYTFVGWNTKADGSGSAYQPGDKYNLVATDGKVVTLYAQWEANTYTVEFNANGGNGSMEAQSFTYDEAQKLSANTFTRYGYEFTGWNTAADGTGTAYANEAEVKNLLTEGSITLYAQWKRVLFTVTFDSNGGSEVASQEVYYESTAAKPADPSRKGYVFKGWMLDGEMYDFSTPVTEDITLVAKWNKLLHVIPGEEEAPEEPAEPELPFKDIDPNADYYDELVKIYEAGIMNGTGADKFEPDTTLSRAMVATILYRLSGEKYEGEAASFKDVEADQWYTEAIAWAASKGIVKGYDADRFGPMDNVTREQTAAMLLRYAQYKEMDVSASEMNTLLGYEDASSVSDWALTGMQFAIGEELMTGITEKTLAPQADMTRILTAVAVARLMD